MASTEYLSPIDTVEDALRSGMPLYCWGGAAYDERMHSDPRARVRKLAKYLHLYDFESTGALTPKYVQDK